MIDGIKLTEELGNIYLCAADRIMPEDEYMCHMMESNHIPGLVDMSRGFAGTESVLKYDVSNLRSLTDEYAHRVVKLSELQTLLEEISRVRSEAGAYLLDEHMICTDPDYIYYSMEDGSVKLLLLPYELPAERGKFYPLADFFLAKVDSNDEAAVKLAYDFYRLSREQLFSLESFLRFIQGNKLKEGGEQQSGSCNEPPTVEDTSYSMLQEDTSTTPQYVGVDAPRDNSVKKKHRKSLLSFLHGRKKEEEEAIFNAFQATVDDYWQNDGVTSDEDEMTQYYQVTPTESLKIVYLYGNREKSQVFTSWPVIIGKKREEVNLLIDDTSVSRKHMRIDIREGSIVVEDLYSKNGTFINGSRIEPGVEIPVTREDKLQLGMVPIRLE